MKRSGKQPGSRHSGSLALWWAVLLAFAVNTADAAVQASVDRDRVAAGESLRLTITSDGDEQVSEIPLAPLEQYFEILQRSTSSNVNIVNGRRTHTRKLLLDLMPRREGELTIPALPAGAGATSPINISVAPRADDSGAASDEVVMFSAELDRERVYVQGQLLLTLTVQVAVSLDSPSISELKLPGAFVKQLGQNSYQRSIDGRAWRVHEIRYAIFPEQSGTLEIPAQTFTARESVPRRSLFDRGGGRHLRRTTDPLSIEVTPRPAGFSGNTWLPALEVTLEERWSTPPEQLQAGESTTRTVQLVGHGLQGAQLPPVLFPPVDGLKYYPDQPSIEDREDRDGLVGVRQDSAALVPTRAGVVEIPEIRIPWWDTRSDSLRYAVLPARTVTVNAAEPVAGKAAGDSAAEISIAGAEPIGVDNAANDSLWRWTTAGFAAAWLATLGWIGWSRQQRGGALAGGPPGNNGAGGPVSAGERAAFRAVMAACAGNNPAGARQGLIAWCAAAVPGQKVFSLEQVRAAITDPRLGAEITLLNRHLYGDLDETWDGMALAEIVKDLRQQVLDPTAKAPPDLALYPQPG